MEHKSGSINKAYLWFRASLGCVLGKAVGLTRKVEFSSVTVKFASKTAMVEFKCLQVKRIGQDSQPWVFTISGIHINAKTQENKAISRNTSGIHVIRYICLRHWEALVTLTIKTIREER